MIELFFGALVLIFMFLVDWRLNRIYQELHRLNETMQRPGSEPARTT